MLPFKLKINGCKVNYTGIYTCTYQSCGLLYCFNARVKGNGKDMCFRITSKAKNFGTLFSIDIVNQKLDPIVGIHIKDQNDDNSELVANRIIYHIITGKNNRYMNLIHYYLVFQIY